MTHGESEVFIIILDKALNEKARHCFAFGEPGARNEYKYKITAYLLERSLRGETKIIQTITNNLLK